MKQAAMQNSAAQNSC